MSGPRGPMVGEAYVEIRTNFGNSKQAIEAQLAEEGAMMEEAGKQGAARHNKAFRDEMEKNAGLGEAIVNAVERDEGKINAAGKLLGDDFGSALRTSLTKRLSGQTPEFVEALAKNLETNLDEMAKRGTLGFTQLDDGTRQFAADLRGPLLNAEKAARAEMEQLAREAEKASAAAEKAGQAEIDRLAQVAEKARAAAEKAAASARKDVDTALGDIDKLTTKLTKLAKQSDDTAKSMGGIHGQAEAWALAILALGPATVPLAAGLTALASGLLGVGTAGALAFIGIRQEMQKNTALGIQYRAALKPITNELQNLESISAAGAFAGISTAIRAALPLFPSLNAAFRLLSGNLGVIVGQTGVGFVNIFHAMTPLFVQLGDSLASLATRFANWTSATGGFTKFVQYAEANLPQAAKFFTELGKAILSILDAAVPVGGSMLQLLTGILRVIDLAPPWVLSIGLVVGQMIALAKYSGIVVGGIKSMADAIKSFSGVLLGAAEKLGIYTTATTRAAQEQAAAVIESATAKIAAFEAEAVAAGLPAEAMAVATAAMEAELATQSEAVLAAAAVEELSFTALIPVIGLVVGAIGVVALALFGQKKATDTAKDSVVAYRQALDDIGRGDAAGTLAAVNKQLQDKGAFTAVTDLNKALGTTVETAAELGQAVTDKTGLANFDKQMQTTIDTAKQTSAALQEQQNIAGSPIPGVDQKINQQQAIINSATKLKDIVDLQAKAYNEAADAEAAYFQSLGQSATKVNDLAAALRLTKTETQNYAAAIGVTFDALGIAQQNQQTLTTDISSYITISKGATASTQLLLDAMQAYGKSAGTAADKGALVSASLRAANGDLLIWGSSINAAAVAAANLGTGMDKATQASGFLKTGTIDFAKAGAQPLISYMTGLQDAAQKAAAAEYQHEQSLVGSKKAVDDAVDVYRKYTQGSLADNRVALGLTADKAKALGDKYLGLPRDIKTKLEMLGTDPVVKALDQIGGQLAHLTHVPWQPLIVPPDVGPAKAAIASIPTSKNVYVHPAVDNAALQYTQSQMDSLAATRYVQFIPVAAGHRQEAAAAALGLDTGGIVTGPSVRMLGETGAEAVVPLTKPPSQVDPSVRALSALAQGKAIPGNVAASPSQFSGGTYVARQLNVAKIEVSTPATDTLAVAQMVLNRLVSAGYA